VTPHLAGEHASYADPVLPIIEHDLDAFLRGEPDEMVNATVRAR